MRFGSRWAFEGDCLDNQFNSGFSEALLCFNREALMYGQGLSQTLARDYAMEYATMLQNEAKGLEGSRPRIPYGLFEPDSNLIRANLERMLKKHFPSKIGRRSGQD
jgi:hypothetical protein